jgi:hypothetical protein
MVRAVPRKRAARAPSGSSRASSSSPDAAIAAAELSRDAPERALKSQ